MTLTLTSSWVELSRVRFNPARALGPMVATGTQRCLAYVTAPIVAPSSLPFCTTVLARLAHEGMVEPAGPAQSPRMSPSRLMFKVIQGQRKIAPLCQSAIRGRFQRHGVVWR